MGPLNSTFGERIYTGQHRTDLKILVFIVDIEFVPTPWIPRCLRPIHRLPDRSSHFGKSCRANASLSRNRHNSCSRRFIHSLSARLGVVHTQGEHINDHSESGSHRWLDPIVRVYVFFFICLLLFFLFRFQSEWIVLHSVKWSAFLIKIPAQYALHAASIPAGHTRYCVVRVQTDKCR